MVQNTAVITVPAKGTGAGSIPNASFGKFFDRNALIANLYKNIVVYKPGVVGTGATPMSAPSPPTPPSPYPIILKQTEDADGRIYRLDDGTTGVPILVPAISSLNEAYDYLLSWGRAVIANARRVTYLALKVADANPRVNASGAGHSTGGR